MREKTTNIHNINLINFKYHFELIIDYIIKWQWTLDKVIVKLRVLIQPPPPHLLWHPLSDCVTSWYDNKVIIRAFCESWIVPPSHIQWSCHPRYLTQRSLRPGEKYWRDYKIQFTEEKHLSIDWSQAEEWKSISLESRGVSDQARDVPWDPSLLTALVSRPVTVYESLASLSKETSFLAVITQVKYRIKICLHKNCQGRDFYHIWNST